MQRKYTYNHISGVLEIIETDGSKTFIPFLDFFRDLCEFAGIGFGRNGIVTSTGPFAGEMKALSDKVIAAHAKDAGKRMWASGEIDALIRGMKPCLDALRQRVVDIEIDCRLQMFQHLRTSVRELYNGGF